MSGTTRLVVVGNGPVSHQFLETLVESGKANQFDITLFGEEPRPAYDRVHLTAWFETRKAESLNMVGEGFYESQNMTVHTGKKVSSIDRSKKIVSTDCGTSAEYDVLVLGTGGTKG